MNDFEKGFFEELEKIAQRPEATFASKHPALMGAPAFFLNPTISLISPLEIKGRLAERGTLAGAPWSARHPVAHALLTGGAGAALGAGLGGLAGSRLGGTADEAALGGALGTLYGGAFGGGLGVLGSGVYSGVRGKKYLEKARG